MAQQATLDRAPTSIADPAPKKSTIRRDIQGLRAIAVLAVIADHLFTWPSGGFVGVDVFFVISGFLITGHLLKEHDRTGVISFRGFYRRRIKRILPASTLVLALTVVAAYFVFNTGRSISVGIDAAWALFFAANVHFGTIGTDYFLATGPVSPLQHFWSLAVEEQFYFVWPWLMLLIFAVVSRKAGVSKAAAHGAVAITMGAIIIASFGWALYETATAPTPAYFSTFSRTWELGVGALLAVGSTQLRRIPAHLRPLLAWLGLLSIIASLFVVSGDTMFPAPGAALPVLASAMVIAAGTGGRQQYLWPLTNHVMGYVGNISYSLYLVHFPIIIFLGVFFPKDTTLYTVALVLMFAVAAASYHGVENPVRNSLWLEPAKRLRSRGKASKAASTDRLKFVGLGALAVITGVVVTTALISPRLFHPQMEPLANTSQQRRLPQRPPHCRRLLYSPGRSQRLLALKIGRSLPPRSMTLARQRQPSGTNASVLRTRMSIRAHSGVQTARRPPSFWAIPWH